MKGQVAQRWAAVAVIALCLRVDAWTSPPSSSPARWTATLHGHATRMPMPRRARADRPQLVTRAEGTDDEERDDAPATAGADEPQFVGDLVREEEPPPSIMQAAAQAKVSGIVLIAAVAGSASLPDNAKPALLAIAALSGAWTLWKIRPVLKAVQAQVQAESTTPASNESGFDPFDPSTAQFIGTVSASPLHSPPRPCSTTASPLNPAVPHPGSIIRVRCIRHYHSRVYRNYRPQLLGLALALGTCVRGHVDARFVLRQPAH